MPKRRYAPRYRNRAGKMGRRARPYRRTKKTGSRSLRVGRMPRSVVSSPFPSTMYRVLTYSDVPRKLAVVSAGTPSVREYRGNSLFDPDLTGIGGQPRYFDTFCGAQGGNAPYRNYNVLACKIMVDVYQDPDLAVSNQAGVLYIMPNRGDTASDNIPNDVVSIMETPFIRTKEIGINASWKPVRLSSYIQSKTMFGEKDGTGTNYQSNFGTNPALGWKWTVGVCNIIPAVLFSCYIRVSMKFYIQFSLLNEVLQS